MSRAARHHPIPDFAAAAPPKDGIGLNLCPFAILAMLRRHPGRAFTATMVLEALKEDINIADNHAAALCALGYLERHGKIWPAPSVRVGKHNFSAWELPILKEE